MIIIPARLASTRFPNKILADIFGVPMVIATAKRVCEIDDVIIATDSEEVVKISKRYNIKAILTRTSHNSGTDRINEAVNTLGLNDNDVVINVQADEPFIEKEVVQAVKESVLKNIKNNFVMSSCYKKITKKEAEDINLVKVVIGKNQNALYFSRSVIPYDRDGNFNEYFGHLGIYGFNKKSLNEFCSLSYAPLEHIEKLEQLRALYHEKSIKMVEVSTKSFGIDTKEDLEKARKIFKL